MLKNAPLTIAGRQFQSRLFVGTGKFSSPEAMREALAASGTQIVTVALRRADLTGKKDPFANILEFIDPNRYLLLPNTGIQTRDQIRIIIEQATVPVVVDAGLGAPSHAAEAMEMGADAVLVNTAIAVASDPNRIAVAFKMAVEAGRAAYEIGLAAEQPWASPTSPLTAFLG